MGRIQLEYVSPSLLGIILKYRCFRLVSAFYRQPGSQTPGSPPALPIPGEKGFVTQGAHRPAKLAPELLMASTFPTLCQFWRIIQKSHWIYYPEHPRPPNSLEQEMMEYHFREVIAWTETLPSSMLQHRNSPHHVTVFQYVITVLNSVSPGVIDCCIL